MNKRYMNHFLLCVVLFFRYIHEVTNRYYTNTDKGLIMHAYKSEACVLSSK